MVNLGTGLGKGRRSGMHKDHVLNAALARQWQDERVNAASLPILGQPRTRYLPPVGASLVIAAALACAPVASAMPDAFAAPLRLLGVILVSLAALTILRRLGAAKPERRAAFFAIAPALLLPPGLPGLAEAFGIAGSMMAIAAALGRSHGHMLSWWGAAVAFDPHAILIAPVVLGLLLNRRVPPRHWVIAPLVSIAALTAVLAISWPLPGWGGIVALRVEDLPLYGTAPNLWAIATALLPGAPLGGLALTATIGVSAAYSARLSATPLSGRALLAAATLASLALDLLLPPQTIPGFLMADLLALTLALAGRDPANWRVAILVQAGSGLVLLGEWLHLAGFAMLGVGGLVWATLSLAHRVLKPAANDNPLMTRPTLNLVL